MAKTENQALESASMRLKKKMQDKYSDRNYDAAAGEDGVSGEELLAESILQTLEEYEGSMNESRTKNQALNDLFFGDPRAAEFVHKWIQSQDPRAALVETFGDELSELATEEGRGKFSDNLKSWRDRKSESDKLNAESEENWNNSLEALEAWGNEKGLDNDKKVAVMLRLVGIAANGLMNKYEPADFDMAWKEMNYDNDISNARREGEVTGRNARIDENKKRRQEMAGMPPALNGQGGQMNRKPKEKSIWADIK